MDWHTRFGLAVFALLLFRIVWGFAGPRYARFGHFVRGPRILAGYLRGTIRHRVGHNPLGAWSVVALLAVLAVQVGSGLFADDDIMTTGPLAYLNGAWSGKLTWLHNANEVLILALLALHVCAVAWYQWRGKNLVGPMIHGRTKLPAIDAQHAPDTRDTGLVRAAAVLLILAAAALAWWLTTLAPSGGSSFM